jgi:hypothetical protein
MLTLNTKLSPFRYCLNNVCKFNSQIRRRINQLTQPTDELITVFIVKKNSLPFNLPGHDVMNGPSARLFRPALACIIGATIRLT